MVRDAGTNHFLFRNRRRRNRCEWEYGTIMDFW
ncbi:MAG: hypothetical protein IT233_13510 [Bacteroidia bacterium]|nr:hypothetical protein [Bacteroidia bacterium]